MSSVSVFAFIDKQGICTETQKYVDELAFLDGKEDRVILDLEHKEEIPEKEALVYSLEGKKLEQHEKK